MAEPAYNLSVTIPGELRKLLVDKFGERQIAQWGFEALLVEAAREHIISRRKAATMLGLEDYEAREAFFDRHGLHNEYTLEMIDLDFKAIDQKRQ